MTVATAAFLSVLLFSQSNFAFTGHRYMGIKINDQNLKRNRCSIHSDPSSSVDNEDEASASISSSISLPVFPLRKSVKLPTEQITLNLYEERYLELAEFVLQNSNGLFGALYCSQKPQIVRNGGQGPIVPMVQVGDIGVVCKVLNHEEGMVPASRRESAILQRRIKLQGIAVSRFRIGKVLQNGYGGGIAYSYKGGDDKSLPFILVEALSVQDVSTVAHSGEDRDLVDLEKEMYQQMTERVTKDRLIVSESDTNDNPANEADTTGSDESSFIYRSNDSLLPSHLRTTDDAVSSKMVRALLLDDDETHQECYLEQRRRELFSYAAVSSLVSDRPPDDMLELLGSTSIFERLQYAKKFADRSKFGWLPWT